MRDGVDPRVGGDYRGLRQRQFRIENRDGRGSLRVAARHFLMRLLVGDQGERLRFAARAGGGGDSDQRQHGLGRFSDSPVVLHASTVGEQKVDALGAVHRAAAAKTDDQVDFVLFGECKAGIDMRRSRVFLYVTEDDSREALGFEKANGGSRVAGADDAGVGDDQGPTSAERAGEFA